MYSEFLGCSQVEKSDTSNLSCNTQLHIHLIFLGSNGTMHSTFPQFRSLYFYNDDNVSFVIWKKNIQNYNSQTHCEENRPRNILRIALLLTINRTLVGRRERKKKFIGKNASNKQRMTKIWWQARSKKNEFQALKIHEKCWICSVSHPHPHKTTSTKSDHHKKYCHVFMTSCAFIFMHWHFFWHARCYSRFTSCLS